MTAALNMQFQNHLNSHRHHHHHHHRDHDLRHHCRHPISNQHGKCLGRDFGPRLPHEPFQRKDVLIVIDATKEFSVKELEWVLKNMELERCCTITLLGVKPWLTFVFSCKTETDLWSTKYEDLLNMRDTDEWKNDIRFQKSRELVNLCLKYNVTPQIECGQGFPKRLLILERIASSSATWVVFDRNHNKKLIEFVAKKVPCNILMMKNNGEVEMVKGQSTSYESNDESPVTFTTSTIPTPKLMLSEEYKKKLRITSP